MANRKLTKDYVKQSFVEKGCILLSEYKGWDQKLEFCCPKGHTNSMTWAAWKKLKKCPKCAKGIPTKECIKVTLIEEDYQMVNFELFVYRNNTTKFDVLCNEGHKYTTNWANWRAGKRCPYCAGNVKYTINEISDIFGERGYELLSDTYEYDKPLYFLCPNGHKHFMFLHNFLKGHECLICSGKAVKTIDYIKKELLKEYCTLISTEYINNNTPLEYICKVGHRHTTTWKKWITGNRCPYCSGRILKPLEDIKKDVLSNGYKLISTEYNSSNDKIEVECRNGHRYKLLYGNWVKGYRCPQCNEAGTSYQERSLVEFIKSLGVNYEIKNRTILNPKEIDIIFPDHELGVEYCGLYWHSELKGKDRKYHINKLDICNKAGYRLITIFEDEWINKKDIVMSRLKNILGIKNNNVIYARNCYVEEISSIQAREFCEKNHLQGYTGSSVKIGLFYESELVSVMTFAKPSISKGAKHKNGWELSRFCSKIDWLVVGGASKLLKYFENKYNNIYIFSYADRRWSDGNLYSKLGFKFSGYTKPNYWYFKNQYRIHRFALRKNSIDDKSISEWANRVNQGYNRIWDCGNYKFIKHN